MAHLARVRTCLSLVTVFCVLFGSSVHAFKVFDATAFLNKPDRLSDLGIERLPIVFEPQMDADWARSPREISFPRESRFKQSVAQLTAGYAVSCLNVEVWPLTPAISHDEFIETTNKLIRLADWAHEAAPGTEFGFYGILPLNNYWAAVVPESPEGIWAATYNKQLFQLANTIDVVFPSLYTFYENQDEWKTFATRQIETARRFGKPVYGFLWPRYHGSNSTMGLQFIPADYWRMQLETLLQHADGIVIWGGWNWDDNRPAEWDPDADWWIVTEEFLLEANSLAHKAIGE